MLLLVFPQTVETQTTPPPRSTFSSYVLQWIIYDSYAQDFEETERDKDKEKQKVTRVADTTCLKLSHWWWYLLVCRVRAAARPQKRKRKSPEMTTAKQSTMNWIKNICNAGKYSSEWSIRIFTMKFPLVYPRTALEFGEKKIIGCPICTPSRLSVLWGSVGRVPRRRRNATAAVEVSVRENEKAECYRHVLQYALLWFVCGLLWLMWVWCPRATTTLDWTHPKWPRTLFISVDFLKQPPEGYVCLFTIKNPSYPEYISMPPNRRFYLDLLAQQSPLLNHASPFSLPIVTTESGVMCCDVHPKYPFLLVIGNAHLQSYNPNSIQGACAFVRP